MNKTLIVPAGLALTVGVLPLDLMEERTDGWIASRPRGH